MNLNRQRAPALTGWARCWQFARRVVLKALVAGVLFSLALAWIATLIVCGLWLLGWLASWLTGAGGFENRLSGGTMVLCLVLLMVFAFRGFLWLVGRLIWLWKDSAYGGEQ